MAELCVFHKQPFFFKFLYYKGICLEDMHSLEHPELIGKPALIIDGGKDIKAVFLTYLKIIGTVPGSSMYTARSLLQSNMIAQYNRTLLI